MTRQIHGVMEEAQDLDDRSASRIDGTEQDEVASFTSPPGDVKGMDALGDLVPALRPCDRGAAGQVSQGSRKRLGINVRLPFAKLRECPTKNLAKIVLRRSCESNRPAARVWGHPERFREDFGLTTSSTIAPR